MLITMSIRRAVSNRKIMKSRRTRRATSTDSGPCVRAASSILPNSGPTKPTPTTAAIAQPMSPKLCSINIDLDTADRTDEAENDD